MPVTVVLLRGAAEVFVSLTTKMEGSSLIWLYDAYDEDSRSVVLTDDEFDVAVQLANAGVDLTGR